MTTAPDRSEQERELQQLEEQLAQLQAASPDVPDVEARLQALRERVQVLREALWRQPTPWQVVQAARHPQRPKLADYLQRLFTDVVELHGDRLFGDDPAMFCGLARLDGQPVVVVGHHKGKDTRENVHRRWGMPNPEGYRKAARVLRLADKLGLPAVALVDTPAAYPGVEAEERGQAEAIARSILTLVQLRSPVVVAITGEGGSGGALAIGVGDRVLMMQYAIYSVIPPEGCAAILWRDAARKEEAASALKLTAQDLLELGVVDEVVPEPLGGAHLDPERAAQALREALVRHLREVQAVPPEERLRRRYDKYRRMGRFTSHPSDLLAGGW
ncbi:MAG: acetyl-CoA carboxylase carboxyltransferase subunit alpha [Armatimonadota bacterium]|nr:acetyl-CoA carboxylase carboxyltransferase subunit alpha [Armatimonadota bacterium]MDR7411285.1 acetyl-CoA carboxylase carboxyltransferase subunit alpha [Armatimonadota bacterium]